MDTTRGWWPVLLITAMWLSLFLVRITAPPDLLDKDQERPAAYMLDAVQNGHWIVQRDDFQALPEFSVRSVCSKPPLYTWTGALLTVAFGRISVWSLYLPTGLAVLGSCLLIWAIGRRHFGALAGFLAAAFLLFSAPGNRMLCLARTDSLFTCLVTATWILAFSAWLRGRGWTWFWFAAAATTLTKGPLGVVFAATGLLAWFWERRDDPGVPWNFRFMPGLVLFLLLAGGWILLAYGELGSLLVQKMIGSELVGKSVNWNSTGQFPGKSLYKPLLYLLSRFLPWSLLAGVAVWRTWRQPAAEPAARRLERFLTCLILADLVLLGLGAHQRGDLVFPLLPATALLAGREAARWLPGRFAWRRLALAAVVAWAAVGAGFFWYYHVAQARNPVVIQTVGLRQLAAQLEARLGPRPPILFTDAPFALQFYLNTMRPRLSLADAAQCLAATTPVMVAVQDPKSLRGLLAPGVALHEVARWPATDPALVTVVANCIPPPAEHSETR